MHSNFYNEEIEAVIEVIRSGQLSTFKATPEGFLGAGKVKEFESAFANYFDTQYAIAFNSCSSALHAAMVACDVGEGNEVITTPFTFTASVACVLMASGKPVFADILPDTFCINPEEIERKINKRTKAIIPVHLFGHPADMDSIMTLAQKYNLRVIEDSAQAIGAMHKGRLTGTIGDCGVFSFGQPKTISTGEGGMLITNDFKIASIARQVRNHGEVVYGVNLGYNYRMPELQAALGLVGFKNLEILNERRRGLCHYMTEWISPIEGLTPPVTKPHCIHAYYAYPVKFNSSVIGMSRANFIQKLKRDGVDCNGGYTKPLHLYPIYGGKIGDCPIAERLYDRELILFYQFHHPMTIKEAKEIAQIISSHTAN